MNFLLKIFGKTFALFIFLQCLVPVGGEAPATRVFESSNQSLNQDFPDGGMVNGFQKRWSLRGGIPGDIRLTILDFEWLPGPWGSESPEAIPFFGNFKENDPGELALTPTPFPFKFQSMAELPFPVRMNWPSAEKATP